MIVVYDEEFKKVVTRESLDHRVQQARDMYAFQVTRGQHEIAQRLQDEIDRLATFYDEIAIVESLGG